jgi:hypothetical protein
VGPPSVLLALNHSQRDIGLHACIFKANNTPAILTLFEGVQQQALQVFTLEGVCGLRVLYFDNFLFGAAVELDAPRPRARVRFDPALFEDDFLDAAAFVLARPLG